MKISTEISKNILKNSLTLQSTGPSGLSYFVRKQQPAQNLPSPDTLTPPHMGGSAAGHCRVRN